MIYRQRHVGRYGMLVRWCVMDWLIVVNWNDVRQVDSTA